MNPLRLIVWRLMDDSRFLLRFFGTRFRKLGAAGKGTRWVLHLLAGNPAHVLVFVLSWWIAGPSPAFTVTAVFALGFEAWFHITLIRGAGGWVHGWRLWWRVRRALANEYADAAVRTKDIQSSIGSEHRLNVAGRPVADHPKTSWWPRVEWPVVSVWCGHPPGRAPWALVELEKTLAANILRVDAVEFDFARDRDSVGRLNITFVDVLSGDVNPVDSVPGPDIDPNVIPFRERRAQ